MANTTELVVNEAAEVTKEVVKNGVTLKVIAKHGVKAAIGVAAVYGLFCGAKKVIGLFKKPKKATAEAGDEDPMDFVPDELEPIDGE